MNLTKITVSDEWTFYLESSSVFRWIIKGKEYLNKRKNIMKQLNDRKDFQDKKSRIYFFKEIWMPNFLLKFCQLKLKK